MYSLCFCRFWGNGFQTRKSRLRHGARQNSRANALKREFTVVARIYGRPKQGSKAREQRGLLPCFAPLLSTVQSGVLEQGSKPLLREEKHFFSSYLKRGLLSCSKTPFFTVGSKGAKQGSKPICSLACSLAFSSSVRFLASDSWRPSDSRRPSVRLSVSEPQNSQNFQNLRTLRV